MIGSMVLDSLADRVWYAFHCLPRDIYGTPPPHTSLFLAHGLSRGLFGKLIKGQQKKLEDDTLERVASALRVSADWLKKGIGDAPSLSGSLPPRPEPESSREERTETSDPIPARSVAIAFARSMSLDERAIFAVRSARGRAYTPLEWLASIILEAAELRLGERGSTPPPGPVSPLPATRKAEP